MPTEVEYLYVTNEGTRSKIRVNINWVRIKFSGLKPACKYFIWGYGFDKSSVAINGEITLDGPGYCYQEGYVGILPDCNNDCNLAECWAKLTVIQ
jgi:hypothetical protein